MRQLTLKQRRFVEEYLVTGNGTEAVRRSYSKTSPHTYEAIAYENLRKPEIIRAINARLDENELNYKRVVCALAEAIDATTRLYNPSTREFELVPDVVRLKAVKEILRVRGL